MPAPDFLDKSMLLRTLFLTEPQLLEAVGAYTGSPYRKLRAPDLRSELRLAFTRLLPGIPEHQRQLAMQEVWPPEKSYTETLTDSFRALGNYFLRKKNENICFRKGRALPWAEWFCTRLSTLPLVASLMLDGEISDQDMAPLIRKVFSGPVIPLPESSMIGALTPEDLEQRRLVETHMHFSNSAHPALIWEQVLQQPGDWVALVNKDKEQENLWRIILEDWSPLRLYRLVTGARHLRNWMVYWALGNSNRDILPFFQSLMKGKAWPFSVPKPGMKLARHPGSLLMEGEKATNMLVCEGAMWVRALRRLAPDPGAHLAAAKMLHAYHIICAMVHRVSVQQEAAKGFDLFEVLARSPLRDQAELSLVKERLIQQERTARLLGLEARISGKRSRKKFLDNKLLPLTNGFEAVIKNGAGPGKEKEGLARYELGVICHFIKKRDDTRKAAAARLPRGSFISGRHGELRASLLLQAKMLLSITHRKGIKLSTNTEKDERKKNGERRRNPLEYLMGVDGAGNELNAPPEVFAPSFALIRHFQECHAREKPARADSCTRTEPSPPLNFTFHVGEEFHHLLSGIRAVDEAITFLKLKDPSRLGHCLALLIDPGLWLKRAADVKLPKLEWLDDLVYLRGITAAKEFPQELSDFLDREIARLSEEVYGAAFHPETLKMAWKLRELGPTSMEKDLLVQIQRRRELREPLSQAEDIWTRYHFSKRVWVEGGEIMTLAFDKKYVEMLAAAMDVAGKEVLAQVQKKGLAIEVCPISNRRIGPLGSICDHPILQWICPGTGKQKNGIPFMLSTDNPGLFQTSLPIEYAAVEEAAYEYEIPLDEERLQERFDIIVKNSILRSFLALKKHQDKIKSDNTNPPSTE